MGSPTSRSASVHRPNGITATIKNAPLTMPRPPTRHSSVSAATVLRRRCRNSRAVSLKGADHPPLTPWARADVCSSDLTAKKARPHKMTAASTAHPAGTTTTASSGMPHLLVGRKRSQLQTCYGQPYSTQFQPGDQLRHRVPRNDAILLQNPTLAAALGLEPVDHWQRSVIGVAPTPFRRLRALQSRLSGD